MEHEKESDYDEPRNAPQEALDLLDAARKTSPDAKLRYRGWWRKATEDEAEEADRDGEIFQEEYRCLATFLDRLIVTKAV